MKLRIVATILLLSAGSFAQEPATVCPADRPVDDIIAEIHRLQSKKANRNKSVLPNNACILGWCRGVGRTPSTIPDPAPKAETPNVPSTGESSSKTEVESCDAALDRSVEAAHNVEVGDFFFSDKKNFNAALSRYLEASQQKPGDAAIHVRLGRVYEEKKELAKAIEHYKEAEKLGGPNTPLNEARSALRRLQHTTE